MHGKSGTLAVMDPSFAKGVIPKHIL